LCYYAGKETMSIRVGTYIKKGCVFMLDKKVSELLNTQINKEFYSAYLYLDFSNYYAHESLDGFANWYKVQTQEERDHAMLMLQYMLNNGESVSLGVIAKPDKKLDGFDSPLRFGLEHERYVTGLINNVYAAANKAKDFRTMQFLDWFVKEQGEEEKNAEDLIKKFELFGSDPKGLYMLDSELKARIYNAPSLVL
jgi:ferritin